MRIIGVLGKHEMTFEPIYSLSSSKNADCYKVLVPKLQLGNLIKTVYHTLTYFFIRASRDLVVLNMRSQAGAWEREASGMPIFGTTESRITLPIAFLFINLFSQRKSRMLPRSGVSFQPARLLTDFCEFLLILIYPGCPD